MPDGNLLEQYQLVLAIFSAVQKQQGEPAAKLQAIIRAGKIAEAYSGGGAAWDVVQTVFSVSLAYIP